MYIVPQGLERWTASTEAVTALGENEVSSTQGPREKKEAAGVEFFNRILWEPTIATERNY